MKTNICLDHISYCQFNDEAIKEINRISLLDNMPDVSITSFSPSPEHLKINTSVFNPSVLDQFYDGLVIAHTITNANNILGCATNSLKVLYLYDLDWMFKQMTYSYIYSTLSDKNLHIILRSKEHIEPLQCLCNKQITGVIDKFNLEDIWNLLSKTKTK